MTNLCFNMRMIILSNTCILQVARCKDKYSHTVFIVLSEEGRGIMLDFDRSA